MEKLRSLLAFQKEGVQGNEMSLTHLVRKMYVQPNYLALSPHKQKFIFILFRKICCRGIQGYLQELTTPMRNTKWSPKI
jgi:hypothetical protein